MNQPRSSTPTASIAVVCESAKPEVCGEARAIADEFRLAYRERIGDCGFALVRDDERWSVRDAGEPRMQPVSVDFAQLARKLKGSAGRGQPLARAAGAKARARTVIDATAGLGQDAFALALSGFDVTAIERSPVMAVLLRDAMRRARGDSGIADALERLHLVVGDARTLLRTLPAADTIYIDPMFPPKRKASAAVRKEMRWLRAIAGEDADAEQLFEVARETAGQRVVVKRPDDAGPLCGRPDMSYGGKLVRYDVYAVRKERDV